MTDKFPRSQGDTAADRPTVSVVNESHKQEDGRIAGAPQHLGLGVGDRPVRLSRSSLRRRLNSSPKRDTTELRFMTWPTPST